MAEEQAQQQANEPAAQEQQASAQQAAPIEKSILDKINEALGDESIKVRDESDVADRIKGYHRYKNAIGEWQNLNDTEQELILNGRKNGGDYKKYFELKSIDPDKIEPMDAIKKKFDLEHADKPADVRERMVEKYLQENILDENPDRQERLLSFFGGEAKKALAEMAKGLKFEKGENPYKDWTKRVDEVIEKDEPLTFELGDGKSIKYGIEKGKASELASSMDDIHGWLEKRAGTEVDGRVLIDPVKAKNLILKADHAERIATEAYRQGRADQIEELAKANGEKHVVQRNAEASGEKPMASSGMSSDGW